MEQAQTKTANERRCAYKTVVKHDLEKRARGDPFITLSPDKCCYNYPGTEEYAEEINCDAYHEERK